MKVLRKMVLGFLLLVSILLITARPVLADNNSNSSSDICSSDAPDVIKQSMGCSSATQKAASLPNTVQTILTSIIAVLGLVAVVFIVVGGINFMTSQGDPGKVVKAKQTILYSVIGLVICALSFAITNWVVGIINSQSSSDDKEGTSKIEKKPSEPSEPSDPSDPSEPSEPSDPGPSDPEPPESKTSSSDPEITSSTKVKKITISGPTEINFNNPSINKNQKLSVSIAPSTAQNKTVTWKSSNEKVVKVNKDGVLTGVNAGQAKITATASDGSKVSSSVTVTVRKKVVMFLGASSIARMESPKHANIQSFISNSGNLYATGKSSSFSGADLKEATLVYIYKSGSGFDYFKSTIWPTVKSVVSSYKNSKDYVDFYIYYKYPGNTIVNYSCSDLKKHYKNSTDIFSENSDSGIIYYFNKVINKLSASGYNIHGYLQDMYPVRYQDSSNGKTVSSSNSGRCDKGKRSNYKYYYVNTYIKKQYQKMNPKNISLVQDLDIIIDTKKVKNGKDEYLESWKNKYTEWKTDDGIHLSSSAKHPVVQKYLQSLIDRNPNL